MILCLDTLSAPCIANTAAENLTLYVGSTAEFIRVIEVLTMAQSIHDAVDIPNSSVEGRTLKEL